MTTTNTTVNNPTPELKPTNPTGERKRLLVLGGVFLASIIGLVITLLLLRTSQDLRSQAAISGPTLSLVPAKKTGVVGESFPVNILVNTNTASISAVELHLSYDSKLLKVNGFTTGSILPVVLKPESHDGSTINVVLGVKPEKAFKGSGILGTLNVQILATPSSSVKFLPTTQIASIGKTTNTLAGASGLVITTVPGISITPTVTATPAALLITTSSFPSGRQNRAYSATINGQSSIPGDILNIQVTGLPFGLSEGSCTNTTQKNKSITVSCPIKGTPLKSGTFSLTATLVNKAGNKVAKKYNLLIAPATQVTIN